MGVRWRTESIGDYFGRISADSSELIGKSSDKISKKLTQNIKARTPVGDRKQWTTEQKIKRYGKEWRLKRDIVQADIEYAGDSVWLSGTYTEVPYARDVEYRTFPNSRDIVPVNARALRFFSTKYGKYIFRSRVAAAHRPGNEGVYMFLRGTQDTQAQSYEILNPILERWVKKFSTAKRVRQRITKHFVREGVVYSYTVSKATKL